MWIRKFCAASIFMGATSRNLNITSFYQLVSYLKIMDMWHGCLNKGLTFSNKNLSWRMMAFSSVVASGCERMWLHTTWFDNISSCQGWSGWFGSMKPLTAEINSWSQAFQQQMWASFLERCFWPKNMPLLPLCFSICSIFSENTHE